MIRRGSPHHPDLDFKHSAFFSECLHDPHSIRTELTWELCGGARPPRTGVRASRRRPAATRARPSGRGRASANTPAHAPASGRPQRSDCVSRARANTPTTAHVRDCAELTFTDHATRFCNTSRGDRPHGQPANASAGTRQHRPRGEHVPGRKQRPSSRAQTGRSTGHEETPEPAFG